MSRRRRWLPLLLPLLLLVSGSRQLPGQDEGRQDFDRYDLEVGGRITEVVVEDLDRDGRRDLLVVRGREALIYFQGQDGGWPSQANQRFRFNPRTVLFDVADIDPSPGAEIVLLTADGVRAYKLRQRPGGRLLYGLRPHRVVVVDGFLKRPVKEEVRRKELLRDLDGDGLVDLLLPRRDGFSLMKNLGQGKFAAPRTLSTPPKAVLNVGQDRLSSRLFASYWFSNPVLCQWDGGGASELLVAREGTVDVFGLPEDPSRGLTTTHRERFEVPDQRRFNFSAEDPFELDFTAPLVVRDLDQDGRIDMSSTHVGQGVTRIYKNTQGAASFQEPAQSLRAKGVTLISFYMDLDDDGKTDLVLPRMDEISIWGILKVLITRSVPVEVLGYYQRSEGTIYPDEPDFVREIEIPIAINSGGVGVKVGSAITANFGDFDGDGKKDFLYRTDDEEVEIFRGQQRGLEEDAGMRAAIPDVEPYRFCLADTFDLDQNGAEDVILRYISWDREGDKLTLLVSRSKSK